MFKKNKRPRAGYQKRSEEQRKKIKRDHWLSSLLIAPTKKVTFTERFVKMIIYVALRLVIKPSRWKNPKRNYELIDRTYKRIMSADFVYIPSSIAFYLIMAFMPILSMISFIYSIPAVTHWLNGLSPDHHTDPITEVLGKFIPGMKELLKQITAASSGADRGAMVATIISLILSTWIASGGFAKLVFTQSYLYDHKFVGGYWMNKFKGMSMVISLTLFLFIALTLNTLVNYAILQAPWSHVAKNVVTHVFLIGALFGMMLVLFALLYKYSPRFKVRFRDIMPGVMVTTIPTAGFLALFGSITSMWDYGSYGSIGVIMYVAMAALIITYFIFVGITTNAAYYKTFVNDKVKEKWTFSKK